MKTGLWAQLYFLSRIVGPLGCVAKECMDHVFTCRAQAWGERKSNQKTMQMENESLWWTLGAKAS